MREWDQLYRRLNATIKHQRSVALFAELARTQSLLAQFDTPDELVVFLGQLYKDPRSNDIYLWMVELWRRGAICHVDLAGRLLCLGLWRLLNRVYAQQERFWPDRESDLTSEIARCLATVVRGTDLTRVACVAQTLARDTERAVIKVRQHELAHQRPDRGADVWPWQPWSPSSVDDHHEGNGLLADRIEFLSSALGRDFEIVLAAYESGCDLAAVGGHFGFSEEEVKRRLRRAWRRIRRLQQNRIE